MSAPVPLGYPVVSRDFDTATSFLAGPVSTRESTEYPERCHS